MRPVRLEMTAFGSYAEKTVVDFDKLGSGIYLVTGDTGAGKSTIFDAVMFALYGEADKRQNTMLHSDYVPRSTDTVVSLEFDIMGKRHKVERRLHYSKNRVSGEYNDCKHEAVLYEADKLPVKTNVTGRVTELVGLDSTQFRSIVMLPQGEFKRFLLADSKDREAILGKLFDNTVYNIFQNSLKSAENHMREQRADRERSIREKMSGFIFPDGLTEAEKELYKPENPRFMETLYECEANDKALLKELSDELVRLNGVRDKIVKEIAEANAVNEKLADKEKANKIYSDLVSQQDQVSLREKNAELFDKALHRVFPEKEKLGRLVSELDTLEKGIARLEKQKTELDIHFSECKRAVKENEKLRDKLENEIKPSVINIEKTLPSYDQADEIKSRLDDLSGELDDLENEKNKTEKNINGLSKKISGLEKETEKLGDPEKRELELNNQLKEIKGSLDTLEKLSEGEKSVREKEKQYGGKAENAKKIFNEYRIREDEYRRCYALYLDGQAALLSDELRQTVETNGKGICKVCGTEHCSVENLPAVSDKKTDRKAVDAAAELRDKEKNKLDENDRELKTLETQITDKKQEITALASAFFGDDVTWEALSESDMIESAVSENSAENDKLTGEIGKCENDKTRLKELEKELRQNKQSLSENEQKQKESEIEFNKKNVEYLSLTAIYSEKKKSLEYDSKADAQSKLTELKNKKTELDAQIETAENNLKNTEKNIAANDSALSEKRDMLETTGIALGGQEMIYKKALSDNGFENEEAYFSAISLCKDDDREKWLDDERRYINGCKSKMKSAEDNFKRAEEAAKGLSYVDINVPRKQKEDVELSISEKDKQKNAQHSKCDNNSRIIRGIKQKSDETDKENGAYMRIKKLADIAEPSSGTKITFTRYVTQSVFREILGYANIRFSEVSGGRYKFVHENEALRKGSSAGLELAVLDFRTGTRRRAESISGGESFLASLSLALGLSDAVQNHAGGIQVDSMFIDEGFGSLDEANLDNAVKILTSLAGDSRQIGIISHIDKLEESIPRKMKVKSSENGSSITIAV